ncbi:predicted protein, partial [Nematostella vectensis]
FWFPEAQFGCAPGVVRTKVGYTGGQKEYPTYHSLGDHTESVQIEYDPKETDYNKLLRIFWENHDSTSCHKRQYMSAIFFHNEKQKQDAEITRNEHQQKVRGPIVTKILPAQTFYDAENYHQKYILRNSSHILASLGLSNEEIKSSYVATRLNGYLGGHGSLSQLDGEAKKLGLTDEVLDALREIVRYRSS